MRLMMRNMIGLTAAALLLTACESKEARFARIQAETHVRISAESARVSATVSVPSTGLWTDAELAKRLVDAGLAPQRRDSVKAKPWMGVPVHAFTLGAATVDAYVYRDSTARRDAVSKLDSVTFAPPGQPSPWGVPHEIVQNLNLVAVVVGGTDRQRDRIATALAAGVGAP
ncbi:MAG: hypothetical protein NTX19_09015 [Gemmatimonadetes bacterium]|nr:hypothetical protein [Gemmatimonadota bacterium]